MRTKIAKSGFKLKRNKTNDSKDIKLFKNLYNPQGHHHIFYEKNIKLFDKDSEKYQDKFAHAKALFQQKPDLKEYQKIFQNHHYYINQ